MTNSLTSRVSIEINAPTSKVWEALTNPKLIKQYLEEKNHHEKNWKMVLETMKKLLEK